MSSSRRMTQRAICAAAVAGAAAFATACGSQTPGAAPARTGTAARTGTPSKPAMPGKTATAAPSSPAPATSAARSPGAGSGTSPSAAGGTAACASRYLRASAAPAQGTAGSVYAVIGFTNLGNSSCILYGYPGVSFGAGTPITQVGLAATENPSTPRELVTLKPGGTASALLQITDAGNYSPAQCHRVTATWLTIYPPNQTTPLYVHYTSPTCAKPVRILTVGATRPGSSAGS